MTDYVLVPREATNEMLEYSGTIRHWEGTGFDYEADAAHREWYSAIIEAAKPVSLEDLLRDAFTAGFMASGEGYNGEYPFEGHQPHKVRGELAEQINECIATIRNQLNEGVNA
jgi:hypothetical protein